MRVISAADMPRREYPKKQKPLEVFEDNVKDAERLLDLARVLQDQRKRRMRKELRGSVGYALGISARDQDELDRTESDDLFVLIKPGSRLTRQDFTESQLRPLLRQAIVAVSAAVESYVAEKACTYIADALASSPRPRRLDDIPLRLADLLQIEADYKRRGWGQRRLLESYLREQASAAPAQIGAIFSTVGRWEKKMWNRVDQRRGIGRGRSVQQLQELYERRNRIAHTGDRSGRGRAQLALGEANEHLSHAKEIIEALDKEL